MPRASGSSHPPLGGSHQGPPGKPAGPPKTKNKGRDDRKDDDDPAKWDADKVRRLHFNSDRDANERAAHHSLGPKGTQAAPGNHSHRLIGIWLYRNTATNHNSNGNYINLPFDKYKIWDKEYYAKNTNAIITVLKAHTALITYRVTFTGTAGGGGAGGTGRRGIRLITASGNTQTMELASLGGGATNTMVADVAQQITLDEGEPVNVDFFQNCGGTLDALSGLHVTNLKITRTHPRKIDVAGLSSGSIVPQIPGPDIASRQLFLDGNW